MRFKIRANIRNYFVDFPAKYTNLPWDLGMLPRTPDPRHMLQRSSHFLFGARGTGKSTLIQATCKHFADYIDLLDSRFYLRLKADPSLQQALASKRFVVIDEIQRIPELLNEVHRLIENEGGASCSPEAVRGGSSAPE